MTTLATELVRIAAFSEGEQGGNPAGVWIGDDLPAPEAMQRIAAEVGFSETAFAAPLAGAPGEGMRRWRVRYFSPEQEEYLNIVHTLAEEYGVKMPPDELDKGAVRWELKHGGYSGRSARQYIEYLAGKVK